MAPLSQGAVNLISFRACPITSWIFAAANKPISKTKLTHAEGDVMDIE